MTIHGAWWLLVCEVLAIVVAVLCMRFQRSDYWGYDILLGCLIPVVAILGGIILGLSLWLADISLTIGFQ